MEPQNQVLTALEEYHSTEEKEEKRTYHLVIAGTPLRLRSSNSEQVVGQLVKMVEQSMQESLSRSKSQSIQNAAILTALNYAEKYMAALEEKEKLERHFIQVTEMMRQRIQKVVADLETWLKHLSEVISK
ncbi:MAG: cell division protein ZapA [Bdellovibrionaceae bacterium]|nr:cell division protein ZapA [Pseudobdellovibrionaceae bacterium]MDW8190513.1 cell division protein ZapA [Pseudobdellovibrionaceae bacterium]